MSLSRFYPCSPRVAVGLVVALAVGLRVSIVFISGPSWFPIDTVIYLEQGKSIATGNPYAYFPNGFPLLIAVLWKLVGQGSVPIAIVVVNVIASVGGVLLAYAIGREVARHSVGLLAALVVAVYPNQLNFVRLLMSEVTATVLLVAAVFFILRRRNGWAGAFLVLAVLVRTSLLPLLPLYLGLLLFRPERLREAGSFALGALLAAGFYAVLLATHTVVSPQNLDYNILLSITTTSSEGLDFSQTAFRTRFSEADQARPFATYIRFATEHPGAFVKQRLSALWELWGPWPSAGDPRYPRRLLARLLIGLRFLLFVPAAWAFASHFREEKAWIVGGPVLIITAVHVAFFSTPRFTHVVEPLVAVLAAWAALEMGSRVKKRRSPDETLEERAVSALSGSRAP